ncbi:hypothetical protein O988_04947 [Pseudogymnoascus sp. VKM F-3808]|nr:hypothetical protein O988_04947 [Pseudogymnoascus sp. VKM F-3808]
MAPLHGNEFCAGPKKEPKLLAAALTTRMLWLLHPEWFPWEKNYDEILRVSEMTKKMEHTGVNNRVLRMLGWLETTRLIWRGTPHTSELRLRLHLELLKLRTELLSLLDRPEEFIGRIFHSQDKAWAHRCSQIIAARM